MKRIKQVLSLVLAMVMILSLGSTSVQAAGRGQEGWSSVTYGAAESEAEDAAEVTAEEPAAPAAETEAPAEEPAAPAEEPEVPAEEPAAPAEEPAAPVEEPEVPAEEPAPAYPAVTLAGTTEAGVTVRVESPEGALPEGAYMTLKDVSAEEVQAKVAGEIAGRILTAVDITFLDNEDSEIQPNGNVAVSIKAPELAEAEAQDLGIIHINEEKQEAEELTEAENAVEVNAADENAVAFVNDAFSIYAVIDGSTGDEARATVEFYGRVTGDATPSPVATFYVKNSDVLLGTGTREDGKSYIEDIVIDPGIGETLPSGQFFMGWYIGDTADYTTKTTPKDIEGIRKYLADLSITEGMTVKVWAMVYKVYSVTYLDEQNISRGSDDIYLLQNQNTAEYTVSKDYTPADPTKSFLGWQTDDDANISNAQYNGAAVEEPYKLGTTMTISGSVTFTVNAPRGRWLVFDENGSGATYNAPQFVKDGDVTLEPDLAKPENMLRLGYEFKGWFTEKYADNATVDENKRFVFGQELTEPSTTIYAKWDTVARAEYIVIFWKQNANDAKNAADADKTYDFATSWTIEGTVGSAINLTHSGNTVSLGSRSYTAPTGFTYRTMDQGKTVNAQGNTIVNVYFDRNLVTLTFQTYGYTYTETTGNSGTQYGLVEGEYIQLTRSGTSGNYTWSYGTGEYDYTPTTGTSGTQYGLVSGQYVQLTYFMNTWWSGFGQAYTGTRYTRTERTETYTGTRYTRSSSQSWTTRETMTGLYGSGITDNGYTWPTDLWWYENGGTNGSTSGTRTTFLDAFILSDGGSSATFYGSNGAGTDVVHFLKEDPDREGTFIEDISVSASNNGTFYISDKYNGYKAVSYRRDNGSWNALGEKDSDGYYARVSDYTNLYIRYSPLKYSISFMDGVYVDGNENKLADYEPLGQWKLVENVVYGSNVDAYNKGKSLYYEPAPQYPGFIFEGWYIDDACTQPYTFTTMPEGITVYAKWRQIQYRIFLHPQATMPDGTNDPSLDWGSENQNMNFRVNYGGSLSTPTGLRDEYEFIGWFMANGSPFNMASKFTDTLVTTAYDKTAQENWTDSVNGNPMNKFGEVEGEGYNSDAYSRDETTGALTPRDRFWITKKLDLYGKWSAKLTGAEGIGIIYDANGGSGAPEDTRKYKDNVDAIAQAASTAPANQKFLYWVVQTWDENAGTYEDTEVHVYPGDTYTVLKANAKVTDLNPGDEGYEEGKVYLAYTVQLRAEYGPASVAKNTHIEWFRNYSAQDTEATGLLHSNVDLQINEAVNIYPTANTAPVRTGYTFLGWLKKNEKNGETTIAYYDVTDVTENDLFLKWDADNSKYQAKNSSDEWVDVTQVAADEILPYEALYAVWEKQPIYIFHSSDGTLQAVKDYGDTINLKDDYVRSGSLYGGYYSAYGALVVTDDNKKAADKADESGVEVTANTYDGTSLKYDSSTRYWVKSKAGTADGTALVPTPGDVYYLKEVPTIYLAPAVKWVYDEAQDDEILYMYFMTCIDDTYYGEAGYTVVADEKQATIVTTFSYTEKVTEDGVRKDPVTTKVKTNDLIGQRGYIGVVNAQSYISTIAGANSGSAVTITPYWITLDGVKVDGTSSYQLYNSAAGTLTNSSIAKA